MEYAFLAVVAVITVAMLVVTFVEILQALVNYD